MNGEHALLRWRFLFLINVMLLAKGNKTSPQISTASQPRLLREIQTQSFE